MYDALHKAYKEWHSVVGGSLDFWIFVVFFLIHHLGKYKCIWVPWCKEDDVVVRL